MAKKIKAKKQAAKAPAAKNKKPAANNKKPAAKAKIAAARKKPAVKTTASRKSTPKKTRKRSGPSDQTLKELHLKMVRIRCFEEAGGQMMEDGKIPGALHLYVGEEA
ncbi:MAG: hypothetical protein HN816_12550, partial [Gammaproteobacteria bacterium]|nr:hypothetical protein [Gammaproteobacteria bacterium]